MSTRIGRYIFDVDLEKMDVEKLKVLKEGCDHFIKEKHREEIRAKRREYNKKWRKEHREEWNAYMRERRKAWRKGE